MKKTPGPDGAPASPGRRSLLKAGLAVGGLVATGGLARGSEVNPDNLPPNVADWSRYLGAGVDAAPYGMPSEHEAHVVRRSVEWLTASRESSVNFTPLHELDGIITPNGLCFERHHSGVADMNPTDFRLMINGRTRAADNAPYRPEAGSAQRRNNAVIFARD